jgi:hypothetical protein
MMSQQTVTEAWAKEGSDGLSIFLYETLLK